jgi:hypothetical protein
MYASVDENKRIKAEGRQGNWKLNAWRKMEMKMIGFTSEVVRNE